MKEKECKRCGKKKSFDEFHKNKRLKDGFASYCKECVKFFSHENWEKNGRRRYVAKRNGQFLEDKRLKLDTRAGGSEILCKSCNEWKPISKFPLPKAKDQRPEGYATQMCRKCDARRRAIDRAVTLLLEFSGKNEKHEWLALTPRERVTRALYQS